VPTISFMSANFVAQRVGFHMTGGWGQGERTTNEYFRPIETFGERFDALLSAVRDMGFTAIDIWTAHLNWSWATDEHVATARDLLGRYELPVVSLAGGFGGTPDEFEKACRLAASIGTGVLGGSTSVLDSDRPAVLSSLERYDLRLGLENHPHLPTPESVLAAIGDDGERIGTTIDTGWYGTVGRDAATVIRQLGEHVFHVHLKDVRAAGAHDTCRYGEGIVPIEGCIRALQAMDYQGGMSVEHEPEMFDPTDDCIAGLRMLRGWLGEGQEAAP